MTIPDQHAAPQNEPPILPDCKAGQFEIKGGALLAPAQYMEAQGDKLLAKILAGEDVVFNMSAHLSPNLGIAILVRLQTDYAGWKGLQQSLAWLK